MSYTILTPIDVPPYRKEFTTMASRLIDGAHADIVGIDPTDIAQLTAAVAAGEPRQTWLNATGQITTSGDTPIIAAPGAGQRLVLAGLHIQLETTVATTVLIKHGATVVSRVRCAADGDGFREQYAPGREVVLPENTALQLNLSGANATGWAVRYRVEEAV